MSSIRFTSFGAATVPLSKIIPDKDFDIRPYGITAAFAKFPYRPIAWETEVLDWGDTPESVQTLTQPHVVWTPVVLFSAVAGTKLTKWILNLTTSRSSPNNYGYSVIQILVNGEEIINTGQLSFGTHEFVFYPPAGASIVVYHSSTSGSYAARVDEGATLRDTGMVIGPKTFDLTGKWLALGIDMKGLDATIKIQGVEMPYSDYPLYFPIAPTELSIPGEWDASQERPVIEVYK